MSMKCGICGEVWAACIKDTVQGGEIRLCKAHLNYLEAAQTEALATLLEEVKR
jgi:endonuclease/exonuclease/phosphatase family metal-dependent hydrolase